MHDRTLKAPFVLSVLSICLGIFAFLLGIHEVLTEPATSLACSMAMTMLGGGYILGGCWGVCISRKQNREFVPGTIVVHEPDNVVVVGRIIWFGAVFYFFITFGCCISNNISGSFDVCMTMITLALLFLAFWIFSDYRYRCIVLFQDCIEYTNSFGKKKSIYRTEVRRAKWNPVTGRYRILDMEENKLFSFKRNMINSEILIGQFPSVFQNCMTRQEKEEIEDPFEKTYSEEYMKKVRAGGLILCYVDTFLSVMLFLVYKRTALIKGRYYYLVMTLLPVNLFVFSWVFRDVVGKFIYRRWESGYRQKNGRVGEMYISVLGCQFTLALWNHVTIESGLTSTMQCVKGTDRVFATGLLLFGIMILISVYRFGIKRSRTVQLLATVLLSGYFCYGLTLAIFLAASASPEHYPAEIVSIKRTDYAHYATLTLRDGSETQVKISSAVYDIIENGEEVVVCSRTSLFDTEFVKIHRAE